jgi:branched-chain amino acid transport system substrate-binding protein
MVYVYFKDYISHFSGRSDLFQSIHNAFERSGIPTSAAHYELTTHTCVERESVVPSIREELSTVEIFSPLSHDELDVLASYATEKRYRPGEIIVQEEGTDSSLQIVKSGVVEVRKRLKQQHEVEVARLGAGDFFGEMTLLTGQPRSATVRALMPVTIISVPKEGLEPILRSAPHLSEQFAEVMAARQLKTQQLSLLDSKKQTSSGHMFRLYAERIVKGIQRFFRITK